VNVPEEVIQEAFDNGENFTLEENETTTLTQNLIVPSAVTFINKGTIDLKESTLEILGDFINQGTVTNQEASIVIKENGNLTNNNLGVITLNGNIQLIPGGKGSLTNEGKLTAMQLEVNGNNPDVSTTLSLKGEESIFNVKNIINNGAGAFNIVGITTLSKTVIKCESLETHSPTTLTNLQWLTENMQATDTLTLDNTYLKSSEMHTTKSLTIKNNSEFECINGMFDTGEEESEVNIDKQSSLKIIRENSFKSKIINKGIVSIIVKEANLQLNNTTFENTGVINNNGTLKQFGDTNSTINTGGEPFGIINTNGTVSGLNLENQQINTEGDGIVIAGIKNDDGFITVNNSKTVKWTANYNPGENNWKIKRMTPEDGKFDMEYYLQQGTFHVGTITTLQTFPQGSPENSIYYLSDDNLGFSTGTWFKCYTDGGDPNPKTIGIVKSS
jgi:hypothetical protein